MAQGCYSHAHQDRRRRRHRSRPDRDPLSPLGPRGRGPARPLGGDRARPPHRRRLCPGPGRPRFRPAGRLDVVRLRQRRHRYRAEPPAAGAAADPDVAGARLPGGRRRRAAAAAPEGVHRPRAGLPAGGRVHRAGCRRRRNGAQLAEDHSRFGRRRCGRRPASLARPLVLRGGPDLVPGARLPAGAPGGPRRRLGRGRFEARGVRFEPDADPRSGSTASSSWAAASSIASGSRSGRAPARSASTRCGRRRSISICPPEASRSGSRPGPG